MKPQASVLHDDFEVPPIAVGEVDETSDNNLWFLPGPIEEETDDLPPGPRAEPREMVVLDDWRKAEAGHAARLARVAGRLGALDERLKRGPEGWRHRLALIEAADLLIDSPAIEALAALESSAVEHMNSDHADAADIYARALAKSKKTGWKLCGIDAAGLDLANGDELLRVEFEHVLRDSGDLRPTLAALLRQSREIID